MNVKLIKYTSAVLLLFAIFVFGMPKDSYAQFLNEPSYMDNIKAQAQWTNQGQKKENEKNNSAKNKEETKAPESIAKPESYVQPAFGSYQKSNSSSSSKCDGAYKPNEQDNGTTPNASGMFSDDILRGMQEFMRQIYFQLSKPLMIGHSLMCYSKQVAYTCVGLDGACVLKIANINLLISGLIIYIVGVLMAMSIGMYFVDISFKLGFAVLFMPISIALWPFPPTKNKFSENLSIVIRNGMLFTLISIGVSFSVTLLANSLFDKKFGTDGEQVFWEAIANKRTETLVESFAFYHLHFLVVAFGLLFAFKILASSINNYLNYFFSDSVFGSESPMHHMGTQAVGMVKANTIDKAASFAKDVVKTQSGRAIAGIGGGIASLSSSEGRSELAKNIKNKAGAVKNVISNPRQSYNAAMSKLGEKANQAIQAAGSVTIGNWMEDKIAHGGGQLQDIAADTAAAGANIYNKVTGNDKFVTSDDVKNAFNESVDSFSDDLQSLKENGLKNNIKKGIVKTATTLQNTAQALSGTPEDMMSEEEMQQYLHEAKEELNEKYVEPAVTTIKAHTQPLTDTVQKVARGSKMMVMGGVALAEAARDGVLHSDAWQNSDQAPITLQPSAVISAIFKAPKTLAQGALHPIDTMERLADNYETIKNMDKKIIWKKTGQIVARSIKGTGEDTKNLAEGTASVFGNLLKDFGESMQKNKNSGNGFVGMEEINRRAREKEEAAQEERAYFSSLSDNYENDK